MQDQKDLQAITEIMAITELMELTERREIAGLQGQLGIKDPRAAYPPTAPTDFPRTKDPRATQGPQVRGKRGGGRSKGGGWVDRSKVGR